MVFSSSSYFVQCPFLVYNFVEKWFAFDNVLYNKYHTEMLLSLCVSKVFFYKKK